MELGLLGNSGAYGFGGSGTNNAIDFVYDPDGRITDGTTNGPGKSVRIILFRNGRVTSSGQYGGTICRTGGCTDTSTEVDPPWFRW